MTDNPLCLFALARVCGRVMFWSGSLGELTMSHQGSKAELISLPQVSVQQVSFFRL